MITTLCICLAFLFLMITGMVGGILGKLPIYGKIAPVARWFSVPIAALGVLLTGFASYEVLKTIWDDPVNYPNFPVWFVVACAVFITIIVLILRRTRAKKKAAKAKQVAGHH